MTKEELTALKIPEELHTNATLLEAKDVPSLARILVDTKAMVGGSIRIPGKDAGEADVKAFKDKIRTAVPDLVELPADPAKLEEVEGMIFERLGRPKDAKEYPGLKDSKIDVPAEIKIDETELRSIATRLGMTKKQYVTFAKGVVDEKIKASQLVSAERGALKKELGDAFDERLGAAASAAKKLGASEALVEALRTGNIPAEHARTWINVAKSIGAEGSEFARGAGGGGNNGGKMTPGEARDAIAELYRNPALFDKNHSEQKRLTEKLLKLNEIAYS
jgi:hypothetical protein